MRGPGQHTPPRETQPAPFDNTEHQVMHQVRLSARLWPPIHPEVAREIASWYASNGVTGRPFATFASSGHISDGLMDSIDRELGDLRGVFDTETNESRQCLSALQRYIRECG